MKLVPYQRNLMGGGLLSEFFSDEFPFNHNSLMKADIKETQDAYVVETEMPGIKKEDITLICEKGVLTITAKQSEEAKEKKDGYIRRERYSGEASRSFALKNITEEKISAKLEDGVLYVTLPKKEEDKKERKIEIE